MANVEEGLIMCRCPGSPFTIEDGSRQAGRAQSAVASKIVALEGDQISVS